ncbi:MAG: hypothetical protein WBK55_10220 [Alphaproteobacteria bacterium]
MPTHAALAADLLKDAAVFFTTLAEQNDGLRKEMTENAVIFERMASLIETDPRGTAPTGQPYSQLCAQLLRDSAVFWRKIAAQNEPIREQVEFNADICEQIAEAVAKDPLGILD